MNNIEIKRLLFEIKRVETAKMEQELKIFERLDEIERLKEYMLVQDKRIAEIKSQLEAAGVEC